MVVTRRWLVAVLVLAGFAACRPDSDQVVVTLQAERFAGSEWSEPVNLGPVINSAFGDMNASLSSDGHDLFFVSTRPGFGGNDLWMSSRQCLACPWQAPVNLGSAINTDAGEASPTVSDDGRLLFFFSTRPGGFGNADIYVSQRLSTSADGDVWGPPVNLGPDVNTALTENGSYFVHEAGQPHAFLYFNRTPLGGTLDLYRVELDNDGVPMGPAVAVVELNDPAGADQKVAVRSDGLELLLSAIRAGGFGSFDIYAYTRQSVHDLWSGPVNLGAPVNTLDIDSQPSLSRDGRTMIFTSIRPGGSGLQDLWMSTRTPSGQ